MCFENERGKVGQNRRFRDETGHIRIAARSFHPHLRKNENPEKF